MDKAMYSKELWKHRHPKWCVKEQDDTRIPRWHKTQITNLCSQELQRTCFKAQLRTYCEYPVQSDSANNAARGYKRKLWTLQDQDQRSKRENSCSSTILPAALNVSTIAVHLQQLLNHLWKKKSSALGFPIVIFCHCSSSSHFKDVTFYHVTG